MGDKIKFAAIVSPKGRAIYPKLTEPDTRFNPEGVYSVRLAVPGEEAEEFIAKITEMNEVAFKRMTEEITPAQRAKVKMAELFTAELDDDGMETGNVLFNFKARAQFKDKVTNALKPNKIPLFDSKGKPIVGPINIWSGSILRCSLYPSPYYMPATKFAGISLRLSAVQVLTLVEGGYDAKGYGFGEEGEGYTTQEASAEGTADGGSDGNF